MSMILSVSEQLGISPSIIYLYSILPYVSTSDEGNANFTMGGVMIDYRDEKTL
jgi:hypothetical protein